ncbi:MAG: cell wall-associated NlpC family hydrolase [Crocinitomix sp.]|jgi:cell wall-associated NlpC family hydrolase
MKWLLIVFISLFSFSAIAETDSTAVPIERDSIVHFAQQLIGVPYLWGGSSKSGFDCSGFVHYVFKHFGIPVSRTSRGFKDKGKEVVLTESNPGDVILFTGTNAAVRQIGHVGIILKNTNGMIDFIHSSSSKKHYGVTITRYNASGYVKRFLRVINILK